MPTFSVFLPVRNGWPYVQECVDSILRQTYPHLELTVLDNQSTDDTVPWLRSLKDPRIRLLSSAASLSIEESWARINTVEKKEFMTLIGHDDLFDPEFLAITKDLIDRHPSASLYQTGSRLINAEGAKIRACRPVPERETAADYLTARLTLQREVFGTGYVMRSADYERVGGIPPFEKLFYADDALWLSLARISYKAADPREAFAVRIHPRSESASLPSAWRAMLDSLNQFTDFLRRFAEDDPDSKAVLTRLEPFFVLNRHQNAYIYALIDACRKKRKVDPATRSYIELSLAKSVPTMAGGLTRSMRIKLLAYANASAFRSQVPHLWNAYYLLQTRAR